MIPPLSFASSSSAKGGDASMGFSSTWGDMNVNFGDGVTQGGAAAAAAVSAATSPPQYVWLIATLVVAALAWQKYQ